MHGQTRQLVLHVVFLLFARRSDRLECQNDVPLCNPKWTLSFSWFLMEWRVQRREAFIGSLHGPKRRDVVFCALMRMLLAAIVGSQYGMGLRCEGLRGWGRMADGVPPCTCCWMRAMASRAGTTLWSGGGGAFFSIWATVGAMS